MIFLTKKNLYSKYAIIPIIIVTIFNFLIPMGFESFNFYIKHNSLFIWGVAYALLFIYWHVCAFDARKECKDDKSKKTIIYYMLFTFDVSFLLSWVYLLLGYYFYSINVCTDGPSIWCTFFVIQMLFIPLLLHMLPSAFNRSTKQKGNSLKKTIILLAITILILIIAILFLPFFFKCLTWKFIFP